MLTTKRYSQANNNWGDIYEEEKTWTHWKTCYKKAHAKARVKAQAAKGADKFGAANAAERDFGLGFEKNSGVMTDNGGHAVILKALVGYLDKLSANATNKKTAHEELIASNDKLAATNKELVAILKKLTNDNKDLQRESNCLKKRGNSGVTQSKREPTMCPHFNTEVYHETDACCELSNNKDKPPPGWKSGL